MELSRLRFLANENFPLSSVKALRALGWDILSISECSPGISDLQVIQLACEQARIIITFDADYGELIFHRNVAAPPAIIYLRFTPLSGEEGGKIIAELISQFGQAIVGYFCTVDRTMVRRRSIN